MKIKVLQFVIKTLQEQTVSCMKDCWLSVKIENHEFLSAVNNQKRHLLTFLLSKDVGQERALRGKAVIEAAKANDIEALTILLGNNQNIDQADKDRAAIEAAKGKKEICFSPLLINQETSLEARIKIAKTIREGSPLVVVRTWLVEEVDDAVLIRAAKEDRGDLLSFLLSPYVDQERALRGKAVIESAKANDTEALTILLGNNQNIDQADKDRAAIEAAKGKKEICFSPLLISDETSLEARVQVAHMIEDGSCPSIVKNWIIHEASLFMLIKAVNEGRRSLLSLLLSKSKDGLGNHFLIHFATMEAVKVSDIKTLVWLLEKTKYISLSDITAFVLRANDPYLSELFLEKVEKSNSFHIGLEESHLLIEAMQKDRCPFVLRCLSDEFEISHHALREIALEAVRKDRYDVLQAVIVHIVQKKTAIIDLSNVLVEAVRCDNRAALEILFRKKFCVKFSTWALSYALIFAATNNKVESLKSILGLQVDRVSREGSFSEESQPTYPHIYTPCRSRSNFTPDALLQAAARGIDNHASHEIVSIITTYLQQCLDARCLCPIKHIEEILRIADYVVTRNQLDFLYGLLPNDRSVQDLCLRSVGLHCYSIAVYLIKTSESKVEFTNLADAEGLLKFLVEQALDTKEFNEIASKIKIKGKLCSTILAQVFIAAGWRGLSFD